MFLAIMVIYAIGVVVAKEIRSR